MEPTVKAKQVLSELQGLILNTTDDVKLLKAYMKIEKKLKLEIQFLEKKPTARTNRSSSNLPYLYGVFEAVKQSDNVQQVITDWRKYNLRIDVVCDGGRTWKKVVARDAQSLHLVWAGQGQYGNKDVVNTISKYLEAAKKESDFSPPNVVCVFNRVTNEMASHIEGLGVKVEGERTPISDDILRRLQGIQIVDGDHSDSPDNEELYSSEEDLDTDPADVDPSSGPATEEMAKIMALPTDEKIFLDVTTMVIYVSDVCNGGESFEFEEDSMMAAQAEEERITPVKPFIEEHLSSRLLVTCQAALDNYKNFMKLLGGKEEQKRAEELIKRLTVVPDDMSEKFESLKEHGKVKERSKKIFGTADKLRCNILTSNESFLRAATAQGLSVSAIVHQSRALSELKRLEELSART